MLIDIAMLRGGSITIEAGAIVRYRPSFGIVEPEDATTLDYASDRIYCAETPESLTKKAGSSLKIIQLTVPNGLPVFLDAQKVSQLQDPNEALHHPKAKCVLYVGGRLQQVREDRETVKSLIEAKSISGQELQLASVPSYLLE